MKICIIIIDLTPLHNLFKFKVGFSFMNSLSFKKKLFGGEIEIIVYNPVQNVNEIIEETYQEALRLQKIFNFFDESSELSILNKKRKLKVSLELLEVLKKALKFSEITKGGYDVSMGKEILKRKTGKEAKEKKGLYKDVKIRSNEVFLENENIALDFGSIAKGYITDKIGKFLRKKGIKEFIVNSRGDILFSGSYNHVIGIQHPRNKNDVLCSIKMSNCGVATSGDYKQFFGSYEKTHILNRNPEIISATVVSKTVEDADAFATALFVSSKPEIKRIMNQNKEIKAMIITKDLKQEFYNYFQELIT